LSCEEKVGDKYEEYIGFVNENLQYKEGLLKMEFCDQKTYEGMIVKGLQKTWVRQDDMADWGLLCS